MKRMIIFLMVSLCFSFVGTIFAATTVPTDIQQPGTQPGEVGNLETPDKCDNCHGGYNTSTEPAHNWRGSMMANASRDPIFWATLAVAEQDFDGAGDLCIRCHSTAGWLAGRSTPTDGSGLMAGDADGVECDFCHKMTNPDNSEHRGIMNSPFWANNEGDPNWITGDPIIGYYGSGMASIWGGNEKLGPYNDATARHQFIQSKFHRSVDFCGTCHDVSNPAVGDLAHNNGAQSTAEPVIASGVPGAPVTSKAAFNNFPYKYGIVERTFSEYKSAGLVKTRVKDYLTLPSELRGGAIKAAYDSAITAGTGGDYADGTPRYFSCQTCHLRPITGQGCNKNPAVRKDLPLHDMTGGNYWMPDAIQYLDSKGLLRLGGGLTTVQKAAMNDGKTRSMKQLSEAVSLTVNGNILRIVNQTGHKVISGYPEGRRMWLNIKWYDGSNKLLREDGKYGPLFDANGQPIVVTNPANGLTVQVNSILNLNGLNTKIYEAHYGMTQEWASQLLTLGYSSDLPLSYDRYTGATDLTLGQLAAQAQGTDHETFHFVLNNKVVKDNRIPPFMMSYDEASVRNALPVPAAQYGPDAYGFYNYWDEITLNPPAGAAYAVINMLYQPTSWEYIQFLYLANNRGNAFLANEGVNMLDAWLNNGMATPYTMASVTWGTAPAAELIVNSLTTWSVDRNGKLVSQTSAFSRGATVAVVALTVDQAGLPLSGAQVFIEIRNSAGALITSLQGFSDTSGNAVMKWKTSKTQTSGTYTANVTNVIKNGYQFNFSASVTTVSFTVN